MPTHETDPIPGLVRAVSFAGLEATNAGIREAMRTETDFIGRMNDSFSKVHQNYDDETETFPDGDARDDAIEALISLAGLCIGLVAMLRTPGAEEC